MTSPKLPFVAAAGLQECVASQPEHYQAFTVPPEDVLEKALEVSADAPQE